jgi:hypothetical protein
MDFGMNTQMKARIAPRALVKDLLEAHDMDHLSAEEMMKVKGAMKDCDVENAVSRIAQMAVRVELNRLLRMMA